jgi:hypothetical protein
MPTRGREAVVTRELSFVALRRTWRARAARDHHNERIER